MPFPFQAILFDLDGTLIDSYAAITASVNHVRALHGLPPLEETDVRRRVGHGLLQLMADVVPGGNPMVDAQHYHSHHLSVMIEHTHLLPGVLPALQKIQAAGIRQVVCSNKPVAITRSLLEGLHVAAYFDAAYGPEDAGIPKPDPAMIRLALSRLGICPENALFVGDMPIDVQTARNAGLTVWVLPTGSSDRETLERAQPDRILNSMDELPVQLC